MRASSRVRRRQGDGTLPTVRRAASWFSASSSAFVISSTNSHEANACEDQSMTKVANMTPPIPASRSTCRRQLRLWRARFKVSPRSQIATCQQSRSMQSWQTRDKALRRQIEKLAQQWSWAPSLICFIRSGAGASVRLPAKANLSLCD
jgi:hypothetical protein